MVFDGRGESFDLVSCKFDVSRLTPNSNPDSVHRLSCFVDFIAGQADVCGLPLNVDRDPVGSACVNDPVVFNEVAVGPEVASAIVVSKQDSDFATASNLVVPHDVVGVVVHDLCTIAAVVDHPVAFRQTEFHAPAPEQALVVAFEYAVSNQWPLGTGARMDSQV